MADNKEKKTNPGPGSVWFVGLLTALFVILKLCNVITWSWVWVMSPIWITFGFSIVTLLLLLLIFKSKK